MIRGVARDASGRRSMTGTLQKTLTHTVIALMYSRPKAHPGESFVTVQNSLWLVNTTAR